MRKILSVLIIIAFVAQLTGCGTLMYPERKGQRGGNIDTGVAILDGIGLLFAVIPGLIAFAIDFNNGTIYLPGTSKASLELKNMRQVKFDPRHSTVASIEKTLKEETGYEVKLDQKNIKVSKLTSVDDMMVHFAKEERTI